MTVKKKPWGSHVMQKKNEFTAIVCGYTLLKGFGVKLQQWLDYLDEDGWEKGEDAVRHLTVSEDGDLIVQYDASIPGSALWMYFASKGFVRQHLCCKECGQPLKSL